MTNREAMAVREGSKIRTLAKFDPHFQYRAGLGQQMSTMTSQIFTVTEVFMMQKEVGYFRVKENGYGWSPDMIECVVQEKIED